jgi:hypothetical protein
MMVGRSAPGRDIGPDQLLGLNPQRHMGFKRGDEFGIAGETHEAE